MYNLKEVIEANTVDGVIDYEKVMGTLDTDYVNPIVAKKTDKEKLSKEAVSTLVKELGIDGENVDDLKLYIKQMGGNTDEIKEANIKLQKEFDILKSNYDIEVDTRTKLENETKLSNQIALVRGLGFDNENEIEYMQFKFNKLVSDDKTFDQVVEEYAKENGVKTTTRFVKDDFGGKGSDKEIDITNAFDKLMKNRRK